MQLHPLLLLVPFLSAAAGDRCPDVQTFRSSNITDGSFDPLKVNGLWYELAYHDPAQIGSTCQTLNSSLDTATGKLVMPFSVKYGPIPFTIVEEYSPTSEVGVYSKIALPPVSGEASRAASALALSRLGRRAGGGDTLTLPTVFVDVTTSSSGASEYETMTLYSCVQVDDDHIATELIFASRDKDATDETLDEMEAVARAQGVEWDDEDLVRSSCGSWN